MEYVRAANVQELLNKQKRIPTEQAVRMILDAARGLQYAHGKESLPRQAALLPARARRSDERIRSGMQCRLMARGSSLAVGVLEARWAAVEDSSRTASPSGSGFCLLSSSCTLPPGTYSIEKVVERLVLLDVVDLDDVSGG